MERTDQIKKFKLANIFGEGMVLQREKPVKLWGKGNSGEKVTLTLAGKQYETTIDEDGKWSVVIDPMEAGGPYEMQVQTNEDEIVLHDVLFGDVWLCAGQSNMELPINRVMERYREEILSYENDAIRLFRVERAFDYNKEHDEVEEGSWKTVNQKDVQDFSAVAYFFAKAIYRKYQIPVGLISTGVGGSRVESWTQEDILRNYPDIVEELKVYQDTKKFEAMLKENEREAIQWYTELENQDQGLQEEKWYSSNLDISDWKETIIPGEWKQNGIHITAGSVWFKKEVELSESQASKKARIFLGTIVDSDRVYINDVEVGRIEYCYPPRIYKIPEGVLKAGKNIITIRAVANSDQGKFTLDKFYGLELEEERIDLSGKWLYKIGKEVPPSVIQIFLPHLPLGLFNGMIAPLTGMKLKGVIWYQGESNDSDPSHYKERFMTLIKSWRERLGNGKLPFIYAQLPRFGEIANRPQQSNWAEIRQAQLEALEVPDTAMATILDAGEWNDLHPLDKKDVGERLALGAEAIAYGEVMTYCGPIVKSGKVVDGKVIIDFDHIGSGLTLKEGTKLSEFAISEDHEHFVWAKAEIKGDQVVVWHEQITKPVAVRYAWADAPMHANLCNKEGLMASPFEITL